MSGSTVWEHSGRIAEVEIVLTTLRAFQRTVCHEVIIRLVPVDMTDVCGEGGVHIRVAQGII